MKAGIVGVGKLGGTIAFDLADEELFDELVLCDVIEDLARAQAEDIRDGLGGKADTYVRAGPMDDLHDADAIVLAAGQGRKPGMTRLDLLHTNAGVVADAARAIGKIAPKATLVVLTNPLDVMTTVAWSASGLPRDRVVGSGQLLDSIRLRWFLADRYGVKASDVEAVVLGEHGDRAVPIFSRVRVRGKPIDLTPQERMVVREELRTLSARLIEVKGGTIYGPSGATTSLVRALVADGETLVPSSVILDGEFGLRDVAMGAPAVLGRGRVLRVEDWPLWSDEQAALQEAGHALANYADDAEILLGLGVHHDTSLDHLTRKGP